MMLNYVQCFAFDIARGKKPPEDFNVIRVPLIKTFDWNIVYRRMNEMYDALQEPPPREKFRAIVKALEKKPTAWEQFSMALKPYYLENAVARNVLALFDPGADTFEAAIQRMECLENMQRLALALRLYQIEHGKLPDANWAAQIEKYLGEKPEQYLSCPSNPSPKGQTTYALVQYDGKIPESHETIVLFELKTPVPLDKAVVMVDEVLALATDGEQPTPHPGVIVTARKSGAVQLLTKGIDEKELLRLLGRSAE